VFFYPGARWEWVVSATPRPLYPRKDTWYPVCRRLRGPQDPSGRVRKVSLTPGFDPRTVDALPFITVQTRRCRTLHCACTGWSGYVATCGGATWSSWIKRRSRVGKVCCISGARIVAGRRCTQECIPPCPRTSPLRVMFV